MRRRLARRGRVAPGTHRLDAEGIRGIGGGYAPLGPVRFEVTEGGGHLSAESVARSEASTRSVASHSDEASFCTHSAST